MAATVQDLIALGIDPQTAQNMVDMSAMAASSTPVAGGTAAASTSPMALAGPNASSASGAGGLGGLFGGGGGGLGMLGGAGGLTSILGDIGAPSGTGSTGSGISGAIGGGLTGAEIGTTIFPGWGTLIGGLIGALGGGLGGSGMFDAGLPREAKTAGVASALSGSPNQLDSLLGSFAQRGVNQGHVLSEGGSSTFGGALQRIAGMLEALTGQQAPGVTASSDPSSGTNFQHPTSLGFTKLGKIGEKLQLPAGYQFITDPTGINTAFKDIEKVVGSQAPTTGGPGQQREWEKVIQQLIQSGTLQRYTGALGPQGATNTSPGAIPNVSLPHPLAPSPGTQVQAPYPI